MTEVETLYIEYSNDSDFIDKLCLKLISFIDIKDGMDIELLDFSAQALENARSIEKGTHKQSENWRKFSFDLRRLAHKIHRKYGERGGDGSFLRSV
jgi:hypothetical protein